MNQKYKDRILIKGLMCSLIFLFIISCAHNSNGPWYRVHNASTLSKITKGSLWMSGEMESTPVVFSGQTLVVTAGRTTNHITIYNYNTKALVSNVPSTLALVSAFVEGGTLYIYGTDLSTIQVITTTDLSTYSTPQVILRAASGEQLFNSSVTKNTDTGEFVMVYESCVSGQVCFQAKFLKSSDLINWTQFGGQTRYGYYTACPTIRYVDGYYYIFFLTHNPPKFTTLVTRSRDLFSFQDSKIAVIAPDSGDYALNTSDMDLVEVGGQVIILYANLYQNIPSPADLGIRSAAYNGTLRYLKMLWTEGHEAAAS